MFPSVIKGAEAAKCNLPKVNKEEDFRVTT